MSIIGGVIGFYQRQENWDYSSTEQCEEGAIEKSPEKMLNLQ